MSRFHVFSGKSVMFINQCATFVVILIAKWFISDIALLKMLAHEILDCFISFIKKYTFTKTEDIPLFPEKQLICNLK